MRLFLLLSLQMRCALFGLDSGLLGLSRSLACLFGLFGLQLFRLWQC